jgi:alpha-tubulin suppressor-like RCC1 family protein/tRNA A-37 threonylcarbamoyl transferase component Bud32
MTDAWDESEVADLEDEYELLGELGRGASAVVYRARDRALGRLVAIKVVRPHSIASADDALLRLAREARTVARLQHPNIVTVHAVKRLRTGGLALVMQLVPGRTLKQAIVEHGPFAPEQAEAVMRDVASALAYAHGHGVVHRDVKPENIFLDAETGRAMLSDFGIAHSAEHESRLTMTGAAIGTPAYMAPEQIDGARADARSDLYSLGLVTWEMLTGQRPWDGESLFNVITKQKTAELPAIDALRPGVVPPRLQYIVERMLQKKAAARWAGADALLAKLDQWVVPNDWPQWEAAHRRRREAARAARAEARAKEVPPSPSDVATIRFRRPTATASGAPADEAGAVAPSPDARVQLIERGVTPAVAVAEIDEQDDAPSWASDEGAPRRGGRRAWYAAAAVVLLGGSGLAFAASTGRLDVSSWFGGAATVVMADAAARGSSVADTQVGTLADASSNRDSLAGDSLALARGAVGDSSGFAAGAADVVGAGERPLDSMRRVSDDREAATSVPVVSGDSALRRPRRRAVVAAAESVPAAPTVRATDDPAVVSAGGRHSCTVVAGRAYCWGANDRGQLGDGELETRDAPTAVVGDLEFTQVSAGLAHSCGVTRGGEAYCWGADDRGQLGDATTTSRSAPVRVAGSFTFRLVRTGNNHTCGLTTGGEVACWGANDRGQLGDGSTTLRSSPVRVSVDRRFVSVSAGWNHSCGISTDGTIWCWGANGDGQLGTGTRTDARVPQPVESSQRFTSVAAGGNHSCAVSETGDAWCWGRNTYGQLGTGSTTAATLPTRVATSTRFASVSVGGVHSCARTAGGQAWCWGRNIYGQLGDGTMVDRDAPVRVSGGLSFAAVSATGAHSCGTSTSGDVACWGFNVQGQLGDGTRNHLARPARVSMPGR